VQLYKYDFVACILTSRPIDAGVSRPKNSVLRLFFNADIKGVKSSIVKKFKFIPKCMQVYRISCPIRAVNALHAEKSDI